MLQSLIKNKIISCLEKQLYKDSIKEYRWLIIRLKVGKYVNAILYYTEALLTIVLLKKWLIVSL